MDNSKSMEVNKQQYYFSTSLKTLYDAYLLLVGDKVYNTATREELALYKMFDMLWQLNAIAFYVLEDRKKIHPEYVLKRIEAMKEYLDDAHTYFSKLVDEKES